ncbi:MAG TPA: phage terminase large subunit [Terriglobales bacterium]|nr:phage terminase large subunit [Terriglobales bacterium]
MNLSPEELDPVLRRDFYSFLIRSFVELNPQTDVAENWHIEVIADALERCRRGEIKRLIINLPPRSLKSHCASIAFPAWIMGHNPSAQIICASYAQDLADKHAIDCRALINSPFYQRIFPATRLSSEKRAVADFLTTARGCRKATSVGGVLTGRGADFIIVDDPLQPDKALSDVRRNAVNDWYDNTLCSRLNHKLTGCIIVVMQRLHEDDLVGHLLDIERRQAIDIEPKWHIVRFPAIAEQDETYVVDRFGEPITHTRRAGEVLHAEREPREILDQLRETQGEYHFTGQYQQSPAPMGGGMVKQRWFKTYTEADRPQTFDFVFQSWDTASKASELSDYSVCTTWGVIRWAAASKVPVSTDRGSDRVSNGGSHRTTRGGLIFLLHVLRCKMEYPELKRAVVEQANLWGAKNVLIEDKSSGTQLAQDLIHEGMHSIVKYPCTMDKITRMNTVTSTIENGFVYLPEKAPWLAQYIHELVTFPYGKHDDQADSTSQALNWLKTRLWESGIQTYYREEAQKAKEEKQKKENEPVRLTREWYYKKYGL